jgi:hypothetical protein
MTSFMLVSQNKDTESWVRRMSVSIYDEKRYVSIFKAIKSSFTDLTGKAGLCVLAESTCLDRHYYPIA